MSQISTSSYNRMPRGVIISLLCCRCNKNVRFKFTVRIALFQLTFVLSNCWKHKNMCYRSSWLNHQPMHLKTKHLLNGMMMKTFANIFYFITIYMNGYIGNAYHPKLSWENLAKSKFCVWSLFYNFTVNHTCVHFSE